MLLLLLCYWLLFLFVFMLLLLLLLCYWLLFLFVFMLLLLLCYWLLFLFVFMLLLLLLLCYWLLFLFVFMLPLLLLAAVSVCLYVAVTVTGCCFCLFLYCRYCYWLLFLFVFMLLLLLLAAVFFLRFSIFLVFLYGCIHTNLKVAELSSSPFSSHIVYHLSGVKSFAKSISLSFGPFVWVSLCSF